ncbi:MAG: hypothetical protein ACW99A_05435 [Candidatus Kariarchaeaceae archaeon]|jgi:hypothetical protein
MLKLFKSRRGQIRGIDFSLAIIIFTLTLGQILLLTNTFIDGNRSQIEFEERQEFADSLANKLVFNSGFNGTSDNWATTPTSSLIADPKWNLGLSTQGSLDPYKLSRLSNRSISTLQLDYDTVKQGMNASNNIRIEILNSITVSVVNINDDFAGTVAIQGFVTKSSSPLFNASLWLYMIDPLQNVIQAQGFSDSLGFYSIPLSITTTNNQFYPFAVIARFGLNSEDVYVRNYVRGSPQLIDTTKVSVLNSSVVGSGSTVRITSEMPAASDPTIFALFPGNIQGNTNYTIDTLSVDGSNWSNDQILIPPFNSVVFVTIGTAANGTDLVAFVDFPISLDNGISSPVQPSKIPSATSSSRFISVMVRGLIMDVVVTVWE